MKRRRAERCAYPEEVIGRCLAVALAAICLPLAARASSPAECARKSRVIVVADVASDNSLKGAGGTLHLIVSRVLKGRLRSRDLSTRLTPAMARGGFPDAAIWFLGPSDDGVFEIVGPPIRSGWDPVEQISKLTHRPFPDLTPDEGDVLSLTLGVDSRLGSASPSPKHPIDRKDVLLVAQLANFGAPRVVTPPLDGSDDGRRFPKVLLELKDENGRTPPMKGRGRCGNVTAFRGEDLVELQADEALTFTVESGDYLLGPGRYRARLRYVASRALIPGREPTVDRNAKAQFNRLWEGTLESNWVSFTVRPEGADEVPEKPTPFIDPWSRGDRPAHRQSEAKR